jgi:hypothetical protein
MSQGSLGMESHSNLAPKSDGIMTACVRNEWGVPAIVASHL